jgi:hypothetical protein
MTHNVEPRVGHRHAGFVGRPGRERPPRGHDEVVRPLTSYLERLRRELADIRTDMDGLIDRSTIRNVNPNSDDNPVVFIGAADCGWAPRDPDTTAGQMHLSARYSAWFDRFNLLFPHPPM